MAPLRILFFGSTYHPFIGGAEVAIKEITDRCDPEQYAFDMLTLRFDRTLPRFERFGNVDIFRIGFTARDPSMGDLKRFPLSLNKILYPFLAPIAASVLHRRKPYDAIMTVMTSHASFGALFFKFLHPRVPYVCRADDGDPFDHYKKKTAFLGPLFRMLFTRADRMVVTSSYLERMVRRVGYRGVSAVIPNGVDIKRFSAPVARVDVDAVRTELGLSPDSIALVTTSRLVRKNAVDDVVRALPLLPDQVVFLVAGTGPDEEMLRSLARDQGVAHRVFFLGSIPHARMLPYLHAAQIFIRPSRSEGFGISFIEAMVVGLPVIATQEGGIADFLYDAKKNPDHEPTGWAVEVDDPKDIARAVLEIIHDPEQGKRVVATARAMVEERYDWGHIAAMMRTQVFDQLSKKA